MDAKKLRDIVRKAHPNRKIVEPGTGKKYAADADAPDADVSRLSPDTWKKFRGSGRKGGKDRAPQPSRLDPRERFRPRKLTGAGPGPTTASPGVSAGGRQTGKLALARLVPADAASDSEDTLDVLVDEEHGIIGESDSGPGDD